METKELTQKLKDLPFVSRWVVTESIVAELLKMDEVNSEDVKSVAADMIKAAEKNRLYIERGAA